MCLQRLNPVVSENFRLCADAQHQRDIQTIHIGVEQTNLVPHFGQGDCEVDRQGGLPTPPFPEPTAMVASTPGRGCGPCWGCCPGRGGMGTQNGTFQIE